MNRPTTAFTSAIAPRLIDRRAAAEYVNLSPGTFDKMVETGRLPKPKIISNRRRAWDIRDLDASVDALPARA
jgi:predicted DNA-binding transcriptional regulator AlpA